MATGGGSRAAPHVLLFPCPSPGHINPVLDIGRRLAKSGVLCTLLTTPTYAGRYRGQSRDDRLQTAALDLSPEIDALLSSNVFTPQVFEIIDTQLAAPLRAFIVASRSRSGGSAQTGSGSSSSESGSRSRSSSSESGSRSSSSESGSRSSVDAMPPVSCVVSDCFMPWTRSVCETLGVTRAEMWVASATAYLLGNSVPLLMSKGLLPFKQGTQDLELNGLIPGLMEASPGYWRLGHVPHLILGMDPASPHFANMVQTFSGDGQVLINTFHDLEASALEALRARGVKVTAVGPTLAVDAADNSVSSDPRGMECLQWLDKQSPRSVVYVAFGSTGYLSEADVRGIAEGLAGRKFLWAILDGSATAEAMAESGSEEGMVVAWAPQRAVLAHAAVAAFVTHCGWNSVMEAVWNGVPIVGCPRYSEHNTSMALLEALGVAVPGVQHPMAPGAAIDGPALAFALGRLLDASAAAAARSRAAALASAARAAASASPPGTSARSFQDFVDELLPPAPE